MADKNKDIIPYPRKAIDDYVPNAGYAKGLASKMTQDPSNTLIPSEPDEFTREAMFNIGRNRDYGGNKGEEIGG